MAFAFSFWSGPTLAAYRLQRENMKREREREVVVKSGKERGCEGRGTFFHCVREEGESV